MKKHFTEESIHVQIKTIEIYHYTYIKMGKILKKIPHQTERVEKTETHCLWNIK